MAAASSGLRLSTASSARRISDVRPLGRAPGRFPIVPGLGVHRGLGIEHLHQVILRILPGQHLHRVGIGRIERCAVGRRLSGIALLQCRDQASLLGRHPVHQGYGALQCSPGRRIGLGRHRRIDVGAQHQGLAPVAQRALRVQLLRGLEGALRFRMVEGEGEAQALVEVGLNLGGGLAEPEMQAAQITVQRHVAGSGLDG